MVFRIPETRVILLAHISVLCSLLDAASFNMHVFEETKFSGPGKSKQACQDLGYDGLAVLRSPEAYAHFLKISETARLANGREIYIGLSYHSATGLLTWEDGAPVASDVPWRDGEPNPSYLLNGRHVLSVVSGLFKMHGGFNKKSAACGNRRSSTREAEGTISPGQQPTGVNSTLSVTSVRTFTECALACAQDDDCRVAEFRTDHMTCLVLGPNSYSGFTANSNSTTFIRRGFT